MKSRSASPLSRRFKFLRREIPVSSRRMVPLALLAFAACGAVNSIQAATVTLTVADAINTTSFNAAGHWSDNTAPSAANDYVVAGGGTAGLNLRTPAAAGNFTFAGNSLTLGDGGTNFGVITYKGTGPTTDVITINNLIVNGGIVGNGNGSSTFTLAGTTTVGTGGFTIGTSGDNNGTARTNIITSSIGGTGPVTVTSNVAPYGSAVFSGTNTYTGGTNIADNATLRVAKVVSLPGYAAGGTPSPVTLGTNSTLSVFVGGTGDFAATDLDRISANATFGTNSFLGLDTTDVPAGFTYSTNLTGSLGFAKTGANTLFLTGTNTYTGGTNIGGGTLSFTSLGNLGTGPVNFSGGALQFAAGNTIDLTGSTTVNLTGAGTIDSNGNNLVFSGPFNGNGSLTKTGAGTLTLSAAATPSNLFVRQGQVVLSGSGAAVTTAGYTSIGQLGNDNGTLAVKDGARLTVNGDFNVSDVSPDVGTMFITDDLFAGTSVTVRTLYVGKSGTDSGAVSQTGGTVMSGTGAGDWRIGGGGAVADVSAVGTYDINNSSSFTTASNFQVGAYGVGQMTISGSATVSAGGFPVIGRFVGSRGTLNVLGGTFTQTGTGNYIIVGESGTGTLNVSGTGFVNASNGAQLRLGNLTVVATPGVGSVNLGTGGYIATKAVNTAGATATSVFNFHGGTLSPTATNVSFMAGLTAAYVYVEGAKIDTNGVDATIGQSLLAPGGGGVLSIPVASGGAGYVASPVITITGDGAGASAIPVLTGGVLTGVTIINPGTGYAAPVVTIAGGNPTTAATLGAPTLGTTLSGALTKLSAGTLTLSGVNTYSGGTVVSGGRLAVSVAGALGNAGNISLAAGTTLDVSALGASGFTLDAGRTLTSMAATVTGLLNVSGTYQSTGASALNGGLTVNAGGVVNATGGTLTLAGAVVNNGTIRLNGGAVLGAGGATSFANNGVIDVRNGTAQFPANFSNGSSGVVITTDLVKVTSVTKTSTAVNVTINGATGFNYQLQRTASLTTPSYVNVGASQAGTNGTALTLTDPAPTGAQAFYRILLSR